MVSDAGFIKHKLELHVYRKSCELENVDLAQGHISILRPQVVQCPLLRGKIFSPWKTFLSSGDILDSGPSRRRRRRHRNFLVDAITQKQINIFFSNLVHMLRVPKGRSLF